MSKKAEPKRLFLGYSNQKIPGRRKKFTTGAHIKKDSSQEATCWHWNDTVVIRRQKLEINGSYEMQGVDWNREKKISQKETGRVAKTSSQ